MPAPLRVAVVGAGKLGTLHARILSELAQTELLGVLDVDSERAARVAQDLSCSAYANLEDALAAAQAVIVATPTKEHFCVASRVLEAGLPCLVEKPLSEDVEQAEQLVRLARARGLVLMVGHSERFNPALLALTDLHLEPGFIEAQRVAPFSFRASDVGVVLDLMIHDIDLILHLIGSPLVAAQAVGVGILGEHEDLANARLMFANGAVASVTASRLALKQERKLRVFARDCYVSLDLAARSGRVVRPGPDLARHVREGLLQAEGLSPLEAMLKNIVDARPLNVEGHPEPLVGEDREFAAAVRDGRDALVTGEHGVAAIKAARMVVDAIARSQHDRAHPRAAGP